MNAINMYIHSVNSRLQNGGAGSNAGSVPSTSTHVVVVRPINSKPESQV